jgi:hypothetical protein
LPKPEDIPFAQVDAMRKQADQTLSNKQRNYKKYQMKFQHAEAEYKALRRQQEQQQYLRAQQRDNMRATREMVCRKSLKLCGEYVSRGPMSLQGLECQMFQPAKGDMRPRPATGAAGEARQGDGDQAGQARERVAGGEVQGGGGPPQPGLAVSATMAPLAPPYGLRIAY